MNDSGSGKKILKDDDEAEGLLSKNKDPPILGKFNKQNSDLLIDGFEQAREIKYAAIS
jgi:hypothetical protein